ncbi:solute carrier organic anion transporter family member 4A1 isoform X1 [Macrobrachium rosenbergii]|uniref:solute carrier organic anion transporter family member 4A1 isoform X1 n=1 Tax=Macrobrachium rosenbergii TaxID=79674 RepID=UPI0034D4DF6A
MFSGSRSSVNGSTISIPGSVVSVRSTGTEGESCRCSPRPAASPRLFYPTPIPMPSQTPPVGKAPQSTSTARSIVQSPSSMLISPPISSSPPASLNSLLDNLSLCSALSRQSRVSSLASRLGSDVSVAIFTPENSLRSISPTEAVVPYRLNTPLSERPLNGESILPCTPSFLPLLGNISILGQRQFSFHAREADHGTKEAAETNGYNGYSNGVAFIALPSSTSIFPPVNGWIERDLVTDLTKEGLAQVENPRSRIGFVASHGSLIVQETRPNSRVLQRKESLVGCLSVSVKRGNESSTASDPDAIGMGVVSVTTSRADLVGAEDDDEVTEECGWLCFRPKFLQKTRTAKWVLFWLCWAAAAQGMVVNGFVNVCITSIEKRFDLRSTDTGLIAGAYDIASVLCSVPVSYLGSRPGSSKPRWLGLGVFIMGIGSFFFTVPHFASPLYDPRSGSDSTAKVLFCLKEGSRNPKCGVIVEDWISSFRHIFIFGQFLHGVGASPLYTLGITYLDESVPVKMSSMYLGIFYAMAVIGPAFGYLLGGQFLKIYIDSPKVDPEIYGLNPNSDLWLGGWWIGFLLSGAISILISGPIMAFPSQLPGAKAIKAERVSEAYGSDADPPRSSGGYGRLGDLPMAVRILILNPTFVTLSLAGATEGILLAGFATFMPKFLENQFSMPASFAALLVGFVVVPAGGGGTLLGGWLVKKLQLRCSGILKMCIIFSFFCLLSCLTFVISCPNIDFAGVSVGYSNRTIVPDVPNLNASCNSGCSCEDVPYDPICGTNNIMYFSPCHAGCTGMNKGPDGLKVFTGCECVKAQPISPYSPFSTTAASASGVTEAGGDARLAPDSALREKCPTACSLMPIFLVIFFIVMILTFIISLPALAGTLRCVPDSHRSFALGLQWIVVRLLGTIPGPILFGALIDNTCTLWQSTCGKQGSCRSYDNFYMSRYMMGISIIAKALSTILFFLAWYLYVPPKSSQEDSQTTGGASNSGIPVSAISKDSKEIRELRGIDNPAAELT